MAKVADFIEKNLDDVKRLTKAGVISTSLINSYNTYTVFNSIKSSSKMQKYEDAASILNVSTRTIMNCVKEMQKPI